MGPFLVGRNVPPNYVLFLTIYFILNSGFCYDQHRLLEIFIDSWNCIKYFFFCTLNLSSMWQCGTVCFEHWLQREICLHPVSYVCRKAENLWISQWSQESPFTDRKCGYCLSERSESSLNPEPVTYSRGCLTFWAEIRPMTCDCTMCRVQADAPCRPVRRICIREVIIYRSTCSGLPWKLASLLRGQSLFLSLRFLFSTEVSAFGKWEMSNEEFRSKMRNWRTEPPTLRIWFILIQDADAKLKPH